MSLRVLVPTSSYYLLVPLSTPRPVGVLADEPGLPPSTMSYALDPST
jgi:hypothetical protein